MIWGGLLRRFGAALYMAFFCIFYVGWAGACLAQDFSATARVDAERSAIRDRWRGLEVALTLTQPVPYRVFTLDAPRRLVVDFREVDWAGIDAAGLNQADSATGLRFGPLRPGWSRMVVDLGVPLTLRSAEMETAAGDGSVRLVLQLRRASAEEFAAVSGVPDDPNWAFLAAQAQPTPSGAENSDLVVVIDPGHGGIDPGAEHGGLQEAQLMLTLAREVQVSLSRLTGVRAVLTRESDHFVPLSERLTLARAARADLLISLHADALEGPQATGAAVYTLSDGASAAASERMVERHEKGDLLAGIDLSGQGDEVALILQDLVRVETSASADRFAEHLVNALRAAGAPLNARPRRVAALAVLNAADFPSVLVEVGFLSNPQDRARLASPEGRGPLRNAIVMAVETWARDEAALQPLLRQ